MLWKSLVAEFIGTFALIFIGAGAVALSAAGLVGIAFAHGLVLTGFIYAFGSISGGHFNPAVTLAVMINQSISVIKGLSYILVQLVSAIAAAYALYYVLGGMAGNLGSTEVARGLPAIKAILIEGILTFLFVTVVLNTVLKARGGDHAALAIGFTLVFCILMGGPLTGASLNPARTLGPAVVLMHWDQLWIYFTGQIGGSVAAAAVYLLMKRA